MRRHYFFLLALLLSISTTSVVYAQFPRRTDIEVEKQIQDSLAKYPAFKVVGEAIGQKYKAFSTMSPPHPQGCPKVLPTDFSEAVWKFDSEIMILSKGAMHFLSCFESTAEPDLGGGAACIPVWGVPGLEYCEDPPGAVFLGFVDAVLPEILEKCCPTDSELLSMEECSIPIDKPNNGFKLTYWWPENEVETNNFETTAFDPAWECGNRDLYHKKLTKDVREAQAHINMVNQNTVYKTAKDAGIPDFLREDPHIGNSHWAGLLPGDQILSEDGHVWRSYLATLASINNRPGGGWLGYKRNCDCFYAAGQSQEDKYGVKRKVVNGWTEQLPYFHYWRDYRLSNALDRDKFEAIAQYADPMTDMCASYRAWHTNWGRAISQGGMGYGDLIDSVRIGRPRLKEELARICYKGGGELFPIVGQLIGHFSPLPANAYLARRTLYLFGKEQVNGRQFLAPGRRINAYSEKDDKMQRIWPLFVPAEDPFSAGTMAGSCFRASEIPNYAQEEKGDREDWPKSIMRDTLDDRTPPFTGGPKDSVRHAYWNKRKNCMCPYIGPVAGLKLFGKYITCWQTKPACRLRDEGDYEDPGTDHADPPPANKNPLPHLFNLGVPGFADGIPFPFLPVFSEAKYELDPLLPTDPAIPQSVNLAGKKCDLRKGPLKMHRALPEDFETSRPYAGVKCPLQDDRCTQE